MKSVEELQAEIADLREQVECSCITEANARSRLNKLVFRNYELATKVERLEWERDELLANLFSALPFVEDAAGDECYKSHRVHAVLKEIRAAIERATADPDQSSAPAIVSYPVGSLGEEVAA